MGVEQGVLDWLLEEENPSVRYRTLTELLDRDSDDPEAIQAKALIPSSKPVKRILSKMDPAGYWLHFDKRKGRGVWVGDGVEYRDFVTTHFNLAFLAELGMDREDERVSLAAERYLGLQKLDGDFMDHYSCLYAYNLRTFIMMGYRDDARIQKIVDLMVGTERYDGGYLCDKHEGKHEDRPTKSCIRGSLKALTAFAALPELWNSPRCEELVSYFLKRRVCFRMKRPSKLVVWDIRSTIFPFVWTASLLEALYALSTLGYGKRHELTKAWGLLESKKDKEGKYILDWTPSRPRSYFQPGKRREANKWITLYAYLALKHRDSSPDRH
jgi:hypothetical protein